MPFRILVVGEFGGREHKRHAIDLDSFDEVLAAVAPEAEIDGITLRFQELEDFHPDRFPKPPSEPVAPRPGLLSEIVGEQTPAATAEDANDLQGFLKRVTVGHIGPAEPVKQHEGAANRLRGILHDQRFQAIESAWRSLYFLVKGVDGTAEVSLLDLGLADLIQQANSIASGGWDLVVANFYFGQGERDAAILERLQKFNTVLSGATAPEDEGDPRWQALRRSPGANRIGLVIPRFLLRMPYGKGSSSIDSFPFEEMESNEHASYLWGNGAFAAAYLIGRAYDEDDPQWYRRVQRRIDGMPLHVYQDDGEPIAKPCAEILMNERQAEALLEAGLMPLASLKEQDGVLLVQFRSIAQPPASLACFR